MIYRFKNFDEGCKSDNENGKQWDYDEYMRLDMISNPQHVFFHRTRASMKYESDQYPQIFEEK